MELTIEQRLDLIPKWIGIRADIKANDFHRWNYYGNKPLLPTFEYYLKHCVLDKGGVYDFTKRNHSLPVFEIEPIHYQEKLYSKGKKRIITFSMYSGTPFNYKEVIT